MSKTCSHPGCDMLRRLCLGTQCSPGSPCQPKSSHRAQTPHCLLENPAAVHSRMCQIHHCGHTPLPPQIVDQAQTADAKRTVNRFSTGKDSINSTCRFHIARMSKLSILRQSLVNFRNSQLSLQETQLALPL